MKTPPFIRKILTLLMTTYFRYLAAAAVVIIMFLGYTLLLSPQIQLVRRVGILAYRTETERLADRSAYLDQVKSMVDAYQKAIAVRSVKSEDMLPTQPAISELYLMLQSLANQSGMTLQSVIVSKGSSLATGAAVPKTAEQRKGSSAEAKSKTSTENTVQILDVSLELSGPRDYDSFKRLLSNFERSLRLIDIMSVNFTQAKAEEEEVSSAAVTSIKFDLKMYYLERGGQS